MARIPSVSRTQIDRLGERFRKGEVTAEALTLLDSYRRSFAEAYEEVIGIVRAEVELEPTGRPAKSTTSIIEKLRRESIRLSQVQDIAGCRLVVPSVLLQEGATDRLRNLFAKSSVVDRRLKPSHGYRAVHLIANVQSKPVEIQIRTPWQHRWAELSERLSDAFDPAIKYGGGDPSLVSGLAELSAWIVRIESLESAGSLARYEAEMKEAEQSMDELIARLARRQRSDS